MSAVAIKKHGFVFRAVVDTLTGIFFGVCLTILIIVLSNTPYPGSLLQSVKRFGIDKGMGLYADLHGTELKKTKFGSVEPRFVFLDISQNACENYFGASDAPQRCRASHPAQPEITCDLLSLALQSAKRPAAIVVDAALIDRSAAPDWPAKDHRPLQTGGVPVIYTLVSRVSDQAHTVWFDSRADTVDGALIERGGAYAVLAQTFVAAEDNDQALRRYAPALIAQPIEGGARFLKATVAMAAAVAAAEGRDALKRLVAELQRGGKPGCETEKDEQVDGRYGFERKLLCLTALTPDVEHRDTAQMPELLFTLRSLAFPIDTGTTGSPRGITFSVEDEIERAAYVRIPIDDVGQLQNAPAGITRWFDGAVVIIGTSSASANDVHVTPIGAMAGPEVVLNATRAFLSFPVGRHPNVVDEVLHELILIFVITLPFLLIWLVVEYLSVYLHGVSWKTSILMRLMIGLIFVSGISGIFIVLLSWEISHSVPHTAEGKPPPDILTPIVAVSLEGFAKAAKWFLGVIHEGVEHAMSKGMSWKRKDVPR